MISFTYVAKDLTGSKKEGTRQANHSQDVVGWLREQGLTPIVVKELKSQTQSQAPVKRSRKKIKSADLAALCWQLVTMVEGGVTITTALETISEDIENAQLQEILQNVVKKLEKGETLSNGLSDYPHVFSHLARALIMAGETGGTLPISLKRLAEHYDNKDKLSKKVKGAMAYPIFILVFIVLIVAFIMWFIVPRFKMIFKTMGQELPGFTQGFMNFYDFLSHNILYMLVGFGAVSVTVVTLYRRSPKWHRIFSRFFLSLPLFGKILSQAFVIIFCRTMSSLVTAGVSVLDVLDVLKSMSNNDIIRQAVIDAKENMVRGSSISAGLAQTRFFPNMLVKMVDVGEQSGSLAQVLERTADYYERKVDSLISLLMGLMEPFMIIVVGSIVLVVVLALYLPIFTMSDAH